MTETKKCTKKVLTETASISVSKRTRNGYPMTQLSVLSFNP
ncbi:hypothetical protein [Lactococcus lactis]|nr:hypothetical protein [Lactococcus lactis]MCQ4971193.1 hypothetical protein [Lactococcus lactis]MCQ4997000.1 hypothetical protein [Lactococcus lactis]MCZ8489963.1 hypothetical protein [Lactococcus lactis]MDG4970371.1 hypothetical protein [Lactococcus lactis]